jgi:hypothetical protein
MRNELPQFYTKERLTLVLEEIDIKTTDLWTSMVTERYIISVACHFTDKNYVPCPGNL